MTARIDEIAEQLVVDLDDPKLARLHPDLRHSIVMTSVLGIAIKHPLVQMHGAILVDNANKLYEVNQERLRDHLAAGDVGSALWVYERPWRFKTLADWLASGRISREQAREALPGLWMDTELPWQNGYGALLDVFKALVPPMLLCGEGVVPPATEYVTVYRGQSPHRRRGISWTLSKETAEMFGRRWQVNERRILITGRVLRDRILASFNGRGESEIVVDPRYVKTLKKEPLE